MKPRVLCNPFIVADHCYEALCSCFGGNIIECGCFDGVTSATLNYLFYSGLVWCNKLNQYACDTFVGFPYKGKEQNRFDKGDLAPANGIGTIEKLESLGVKVLAGKVENTLSTLRDKSFTFVFLDLDIQVSTQFCWDFFRERISPGGRIGFHDYSEQPGYGLPGIRAVVKPILSYPQWKEVIRSKKRGRDGKFIFFERIKSC